MNQSTHAGCHRVRQGLYAILLYAAAAAAVNAAPQATMLLPALTQPSSGEHHVGKVVWADLVTPDLDGAKRFYGALFGWAFRAIPGDRDYTLALLDGEPMAGLLQKTPPPGRPRPAWLTFLAVRNVATIQRAALQRGGKLISASRNYPQRGPQAILADPDGAVFAVLAAQGGDPPDYLAAPGEWIWTALFVADPKQESAFYRTLFGYQVDDLSSDDSSGDKASHYVLSSDDYARVGLNALPADSVHRRAHWINFVRVTDAAGTARKAVALGGRVLVAPRIDRHGGRLAVLADPSGAVFGVMEWPNTDTTEAAK
ncbi:MAG: VOC family protein [Steroidobacteraceae bacterium]